MVVDVSSMSLRAMASALGGEVSAGQVLAPGPGHSAADRSLSVKLDRGAPDGFVVNSFASDDVLACRDYVRDKFGLPVFKANGRRHEHHCGHDIGNAITAAVASRGDKRQIAATYTYTDANDTLLYQVLRYEPKDFRLRRPDDSGGWTWSIHDRRVLYRWPELLQFPDATVFVCEGEKDADRVAELGHCATTVAAGKWTDDCINALNGRDVFILQDNDAPGCKKALAAAAALDGTASSIRIVPLPDLPDKGDVSDWLDADPRRAEKLVDICLKAPVWQPAPDRPEPKIVGEDRVSLGEWDAGDDHQPIPPRGWLLGNIFCRRFVSSLIADGGVGKTALRYAQLLSLATGRSLTGEHVFQRCRVLIVSLEDGADELRRRIKAACLHHGINEKELKGWLFLAASGISGGKLMIVDQHGRPAIGDLAAKLANTIAARQIDIASLDPFVKSHAIEENNNSMIDHVVQILSNLTERFDMAIDVPHHMAKGSPEPGNANRARGASSMKDALRLVYTLTPMTCYEARAFGLDEARRRRLVRMDSAKVNLAPSTGGAKWFRLVGVRLGNATDLYPEGDEVQTVVPWMPPDVWAGTTDLLLNQILTDIDAGMPDGNRYSDAPNVKDRAAWQVIVKHDPDKSEGAARQIIKTWTKSGVLTRRDYENPATRKTVKGLWVDNSKRP